MGLMSGALGFGRALADARMSETVTVYHVTGTSTDPITFLEVESRDTKYTGVARVVYATPIVRERQQGDQAVAFQEPRIDFPAGTVIGKSWFIRVDASSVDSALVGRLFRARGVGEAGQTTALRVPVGEVS